MCNPHIKSFSVKAYFSVKGEIRYRYLLNIKNIGVCNAAQVVCEIIRNPIFVYNKILYKLVKFLDNHINL